jgi:hypothetical protein
VEVASGLSPAVFTDGNSRFLFFYREEPRGHIHVISPAGEAKFWLEPEIELARSYGLAEHDLTRARKLIEERGHAIRAAWAEHFGR